jgi:hypothetical protein
VKELLPEALKIRLLLILLLVLVLPGEAPAKTPRLKTTKAGKSVRSSSLSRIIRTIETLLTFYPC